MTLLFSVLWASLLGPILSQTELTDEDKQIILNYHNTLRGMVSPTAANMLEMTWDDSLAQVAQNYADKCIFQHNADRVSQQSTFRSVGENLAATSGTVNYKTLVLDWYNENTDYDYSSTSCSAVCGHYTQVVWAKSQSIGCGVRRCSQLVDAGANWAILVCNYGPAGNYRGAKPYQSGTPCSQCPTDHPSCVNKLCTKSSLPTTSPTTDPPTTLSTTNPTDKLAADSGNRPSSTDSAPNPHLHGPPQLPPPHNHPGIHPHPLPPPTPPSPPIPSQHPSPPHIKPPGSDSNSQGGNTHPLHNSPPRPPPQMKPPTEIKDLL